MGLPGDAPATILIRNRDTKEPKLGEEDPVYGKSMSECWRMLDELAEVVSEERKERKIIDFGVKALEVRLSALEDYASCLAPGQDAPVLLPAHLDLLCQTAPPPAVEPGIQVYLHGTDRKAPDARVVWRADLYPDQPDAWIETVAMCPPVSAEMLSVPLHRLRRWLADNEDPSRLVEIDPTPDVEGISVSPSDVRGRIREVVLWRGRDRSRRCVDAALIAPDDVVVLPASYDIEGLGQSEPPDRLGDKLRLDLWELCRESSGRGAAIRLNRGVLEQWLECPPVRALIDLAEDPTWDRDGLSEAVAAVAGYAPENEDGPPKPPEWWVNLLGVCAKPRRVEQHPAGGLVLFAKQTRPFVELDLFADDDDWLSAAGREVSLSEHTDSVVRAVDRLAERCLRPNLHGLFRQAACWHDAGKLDERFQHMLHEGDEMAVAKSEPLAKSAYMPTSPARRKAIREASHLPFDFRHEMLSFRLAEIYAEPPNHDPDLFLHLIASHHGHARPFAPICDDREPVGVSGNHAGTNLEISEMERACFIPTHRDLAQLRDALGESAQTPRFIETVPRVGYRFLGSVEVVEQAEFPQSSLPLQKLTTLLAEKAEPAGRSIVGPAAARTATRVLTPLILLGLAVTFYPPSPEARRLDNGQPQQQQVAAMRFTNGAVSPDGRRLAYRDELKGHLWLKNLDSGRVRQLVPEMGRRSVGVVSPERSTGLRRSRGRSGAARSHHSRRHHSPHTANPLLVNA